MSLKICATKIKSTLEVRRTLRVHLRFRFGAVVGPSVPLGWVIKLSQARLDQLVTFVGLLIVSY